MSEWIDAGILAAFSMLCFFVIPITATRLAVTVIADRNPDWPAAHPETVRRFSRLPLLSMVAMLLGGGGIVAMVVGAFFVEPMGDPTPRWEMLQAIHTMSAVPAVLCLGLQTWLFARRLEREVPMAQQRSATLQRRTLDEFVPPWLQFLTTAAVVAVLAARAIAGAFDDVPTVYWTNIGTAVLLWVFVRVLVVATVQQRPTFLDRVIGPDYRKMNVWTVFSMYYLIVTWGVLILCEQLAGVDIVNEQRGGHLSVILVPTLGSLLMIARWKLPPLDGPGTLLEQRRASLTDRARSMLVVCTLTIGSLAAPRVADAQGSPAPPPRAIASEAEVRKILVERVDTHKQMLGLVVGIVGPDGVQHVVAHGGSKDARPLDGDSVLQLASLTKVFTALLLADAVVRKEVALTDPVAKHLPPNVRMPEYAGHPITLLDLSTHMSGLPREPLNLKPSDAGDPYAGYTVAQVYEFLGAYELTREPGVRFEYSNFGAALLGHVLALRSGKSYEQLVKTRITGPLGMKRTGITLTPDMRAHLAVGYSAVLEPTPIWNSTTLAGAGAILSTGNDMAVFLQAALGHRRTSLAAAFELLMTTRRSASSEPAARIQAGLGFGWGKPHGSELGMMSGRAAGYRSWLGVDPSSRTGIVVLSNTDGPTGPDDIGMHLLDPGFPLATNFPAPPKVRTAIQVDPALHERYVGYYRFAPAVHMKIFLEGGHLFEQLTGQGRAEIFPETEKDYFLKAVDAQITFETDAQNKVTALVLHQNGRDQRAERIEGEPK